jgi:hypothetical protein
MTEFFRFPHTHHLIWLGEGEPRGDKVLLAHEVEDMLQHVLIIEEKLDGANLASPWTTMASCRHRTAAAIWSAPSMASSRA